MPFMWLRQPAILRVLAERLIDIIHFVLLLYIPFLPRIQGGETPLSSSPILSIISGGFQYQLANPAVTDISAIDYAGDDCPTLPPCPAFPLPPSCILAPFPPPALLSINYGWSAPFLATATGLNATNPLIAPYASDTAWLTASNTTHVWLTDSQWSARILLRCGVPCPAGMYLSPTPPPSSPSATACVPCPVGTWSAAGINATACTSCTNAPLNAVYTSSSVTSPSCPFACPMGTFSQPDSPYAPLLLVSNGTSIQALLPGDGDMNSNNNNNLSSRIMTFPSIVGRGGQILCIEALDTLDTIYFATESTIYATGFQSDRPPTIVSTGYVFITSIRLFRNGTALVIVDQGACSIHMISNLTANATSPAPLLAGGGVAGYMDGPGTAARFKYPWDMAIDHEREVAYIADEYNYRVRMMLLYPPYNVTTIAGNGIGGQWDAIGTASTVDPFYLALSPDGNTLYVRCPGLIRRIDLATMQVTTIAYSIPSGALGMAIGRLSGQLFFAAIDTTVSYSSTSHRLTINSMRLPSYTSTAIRSVVATPSIYWASVLVINETRIAANPLTKPPICAACVTCPTGSYAQCNTTYSGCAPCPPGTYSSNPAMTSGSCLLCQAGSFSSSASGASTCLSCANGSYALYPGASVCKLCPINAYSAWPFAWRCLVCAPGTYTSRNGSDACQPCPSLPYMATWTRPTPSYDPAIAIACPFACPAGTIFNGTACGGCEVGTWSSYPTGTCANCTNLPPNAYYTGVGFSATTCAYQCNAGYIGSPNNPASICMPCATGSRYVSPTSTKTAYCVLCNPGTYSPQPASLACLSCPLGTYSLLGYTACMLCAAAPNNYTVFIGRGTSPTCAFYCKAGSMLNRTTATTTTPNTQQPQCTQCAAGTFAPAPSSTACTACAGGTWSGPGATACSACLPPPTP